MLETVWQDFLHIVHQEEGSRIVETWLKAVTLSAWDERNKKVYVQAPNLFVKQWIQDNYAHLFKTHLARLLHVDDPTVVFSCKNDLVAEEKVVVDQANKILIKPACIEKNQMMPLTNYVKRGLSCHLNPKYTFDTFVVGPNNSLAYAAAQAVVEQPGSKYNPLFIYGQSGLGKTHLLHAVGNAIRRLCSNEIMVLYQTADRFVNEFINAIRFNKMHLFQQKYAELDVLLIDDIQFISNKEQTQEAFFHIFNVLYDKRKQVVFSSDVFPRHMNGLAERLRSRLEWGLVTDIYKPPLETKIAILKQKAISHNIVLENKVAAVIAAQVQSNIRELEGSLVRIVAFAAFTKQSLSIELVHKVLSKSGEKKEKKTIHFSRIALCVCKHYAYTIHDLRSHNRAKELSLVRQIAMYLMKEMTNKSLREIGAFFGRKDHSTVIYAFEKINDVIQNDKKIQATVLQIKQEIIRC